MKKELNNKLYEKYPSALDQMERSIECGDGWFELVDSVLNCIHYNNLNSVNEKVKIELIKQKFGLLRIYIKSGNDNTIPKSAFGIVQLAEMHSKKICEQCGAPGTLDNYPSRGGIKVRCDLHTRQASGEFDILD